MRKFLIAALFLAAGILPTTAQSAVPTVSPAIDGIFDAFKTHALVGIGEHHRIAQELDFYAALVRDPRFAAEVGNVVVEFGGAAHQDIIDRYLAGEKVPYTELRKVWTDTVGWIPNVPSIGYINFYAQVRNINLGLPPGQRVHVWLGEPEIDWSKINSNAEWKLLDATRDSHAAQLIEQNILAKHRKALVIYGSQHFVDSVPGTAGQKLEAAGRRPNTMKALIDRSHPHTFFVVLPYTGSSVKSCAESVAQQTSGWPVPALATPIRGTWLEDSMRHCNPMPPGGLVLPGFTDTEKAQVTTAWMPMLSQAGADGLLYMGPDASIAFAPDIPDNYFDADYRQELARHLQFQTGETVSPKIENYSLAPKFVRH